MGKSKSGNKQKEAARILSASEELKEVVLLPKKGATWFLDEVIYLCRVLISSADRFYWDNGLSRAASLAYTMLLSLVPVVALCVGFFASFFATPEALKLYLPGVGQFVLRQFLPPNSAGVQEVVNAVTHFAETMRSLNVYTIPFMLITSVLLINSIEFALNQVWQVFEARTVAHRIAIYCAILVIAPILAISAYSTSEQLSPFIESHSGEYLSLLYNRLLPFLIDFLAFVSLYYLVPKAPVQFRAASIGAFFAALLFNVAKELFALYIRNFTSYDKIYGALSAIPIFLFWLYLAWVVVLLGAEISYQAQYLPRTGNLRKRNLMSLGDGRLVLAIQSLIIIGRAFHHGKRLPNELEIAEKLGCSSVVLKPALEALKKADLITRGDSHEMPLALKKSPEKITLGDLRQALFQGSVCIHFPNEMRKVFEAYSLGREGNSEVTLAEILRENSVGAKGV